MEFHKPVKVEDVAWTVNGGDKVRETSEQCKVRKCTCSCFNPANQTLKSLSPKLSLLPALQTAQLHKSFKREFIDD